MAKAEVINKNFIVKSLDFFKESWVEFKKVYRPTRQETIDLTIRVLMMMVIFAAFLGFADFVVGSIMHKILYIEGSDSNV